MNKNLISFAIATILGFSASIASAEDAYQGSWYVLPGVSYMNTDSDLDADNDVGGFIRIGKELSEHWDVQLGLSHARADEDLNVANSGGRYKQTLLGVDALYMFSRERFRPFVLAGLGLAYNDIDYHVGGVNVGDSKTSWMANVGLGAQFMATESLGLQADVRHVWSRADAGSNAKAVGDMNFNGDETVGNTYLNLGVIWKFGAPKAVTAAAEPEPMSAPEPVAAPEPAPAPVCKHEVDQITMASATLFAFDKSDLKPEGKAALDNEVVAKMKANPIYATVRIEGHTDYLGSGEYNQALSERRANTVRDYVIAQGVEPDRLIAVGMGEDIPLVECKGIKSRKALIECLAPNRRVEIQATRTMQDGCN